MLKYIFNAQILDSLFWLVFIQQLILMKMSFYSFYQYNYTLNW